MIEIKGLLIVGLVAAVTTVSAGDAGAVGGEEIRQLIEALEVGEPVYYQNLTIVPVYATRLKDHSHYVTLDEALDRNWLEVKEVKGGEVGKVKLTNRSDNYIYLMGGEILTGCKQDRIVGRDVLIKPGSKNVVVPVYCVEQGRWTYASDSFRSKKTLGPHMLRAEGQKAAEEAQRNIWDDVRYMCERVGVSAPTGRLQSAYESEGTRREIRRFEDKMEHIPHLYPDVVGVVIGIGDGIASVDIFANPDLFRRLWPKLLKAAALSAISHIPHGSITQGDAIGFLRLLHDKRYTEKPAIDLGFELIRVDDELNVNALVYRNAVIHMAGFPEDEINCRYGTHGDHERRIPVIMRP